MKLSRGLFFLLPVLLAGSMVLLTGCQEKVSPTKLTYEMGERVVNGPLTYVIVDSRWKTQLGEGLDVRSPQERYLIINISVTNGGASELSLPSLALEGFDGKTYKELTDGKGVPNWIGLLRSVAPAATLQGAIVFDVPLKSFRLPLPNGGDIGEEKFALVDIPLRIDADSAVQAPIPGDLTK
ncbi:MAG: DUF4352 domain-containing protein [Acidobacteriota bacterium]